MKRLLLPMIIIAGLLSSSVIAKGICHQHWTAARKSWIPLNSLTKITLGRANRSCNYYYKVYSIDQAQTIIDQFQSKLQDIRSNYGAFTLLGKKYLENIKAWEEVQNNCQDDRYKRVAAHYKQKVKEIYFKNIKDENGWFSIIKKCEEQALNEIKGLNQFVAQSQAEQDKETYLSSNP